VSSGIASHSAKIVEKTFDFEGREARIRADNSVVWDDRDPYPYEDPLKMLQAFEEYLRRLGDDPGQIAERREVLKIIVAENRLAVVWRRLTRLWRCCPIHLSGGKSGLLRGLCRF